MIKNVVDCSFESSDDATVTILAQPLCQDAMKRLARYRKCCACYALFAIASKAMHVESK